MIEFVREINEHIHEITSLEYFYVGMSLGKRSDAETTQASSVPISFSSSGQRVS